MKVSAVINTWNEEKNITQAIESVKPYVDEIIVVDMYSQDDTASKAKKLGAKIYYHPYTEYVEPARNFAFSKTTGDWIILLDADELLVESLGNKLKRLAMHGKYDYYRIPRKNIIFNKWIQNSGWWPDYQIRFFKKGSVSWNQQIHSVPITTGQGMDLIADESNALTHNHYQSIFQYIERLNRYTSAQAEELVKSDEKFDWQNLINKPTGEFLSRFFVWQGYKDGLYGLALSLLQAFSFLVVELKLWEKQKFIIKNQTDFTEKVYSVFQKNNKDLKYWYFLKKAKNSNVINNIIYGLRAKLKI